MQLPNLIKSISPKKSQREEEHYLVLLVLPDAVRGGVWKVGLTTAELVATGPVVETNLEDLDDFLMAVDETFKMALASVAEDPSKIIFSLPDSFIKGSQVEPEKMTLIMGLCNKLEYKPLGYGLMSESLASFLASEQGSSFSGVLVFVGQDELIVSLFEKNTNQGFHVVGRSDDLAGDVAEGLARFKRGVELPAHIVIFDGKSELENQIQEIVSFNWTDSSTFLHMPKVEAVSADLLMQALVVTAGGEVNNTAETDFREPTATVEEIPDLGHEFGFVKEETSEELSDQVANFETVDPQEEFEDSQEAQFETDQVSEPTKVESRPNFWSRFLKRKKKPSLTSAKTNSRTAIILVTLALFTLIGAGLAGAAYWYLPEASLVIKLTPSTIDRQLELMVDVNLDQVDLENKAIPGRMISTELSAKASLPATGKKLVGEVAKGKVLLYNRTDFPKSFPSGTRLIGPDSLVYTLNETVEVASASTKEDDNLNIIKEPSSRVVGVSASSIGANYNIGKGTEFGVANYDRSSYVARADTDISGGTSREITAVSREDVTKLRQEVDSQLAQKVTAEVNKGGEESFGIVLLPDDDPSAEQLSADVGNEAETVTLTTTKQINSISYSKSHVNQVIEHASIDSVPTGFEFVPSDFEIDIVDQNFGQDQVKLTINTKAFVIPILDIDDVKSKIKGRLPSQTSEYFLGLPKFARVEIKISPELPMALRRFPFLTEKIAITVESVE